MTTHDTIKLFALISASYPREQAFANASPAMVALWAKLLADIPLAAAEAAIASHVSTSPFPPSIAEIREWAAGGPGDGAGADAWGKLMQAVRKYGWCNQTEAKEFLGPDIWGAMLRTFPDWLALCMSENMEADRAHFLRMWDSMARRERINRMLPGGQKIAGRLGE